MREICVFCEDSFHEKFVGALLKRLIAEREIEVKFLSSEGGLPRMHGEFGDFLRDLSRDRLPIPDAIVVVADANCLGHNGRKATMDKALAKFPQFANLVCYALPDPHIERWMLADPVAFQAVFRRGCTTPAVKCAKDEYKRLLRKEIRESGIEAPLGGQEFAEDIVSAMDMGRVETQEASLGRFLQEIKGLLNRWAAADRSGGRR